MRSREPGPKRTLLSAVGKGRTMSPEAAAEVFFDLSSNLAPIRPTAMWELLLSPIRLYGAAADDEGNRMSNFLIGIRVVELAGGLVRGTLPPYLDPDCDCVH